MQKTTPIYLGIREAITIFNKKFAAGRLKIILNLPPADPN
jgi:hypothetical protein